MRCECEHLVAIQTLLIVFSSSWVGVGMSRFSELTRTIWNVTENCCDIQEVQNHYPQSQVAFGNVGEHISALHLE